MTAEKLWNIIYELCPQYETMRAEGVYCDLISAAENAALTAFLAKHDDEKVDELRTELIYIRENGIWSWSDYELFDAEYSTLEQV